MCGITHVDIFSLLLQLAGLRADFSVWRLLADTFSSRIMTTMPFMARNHSHMQAQAICLEHPIER